MVRFLKNMLVLMMRLILWLRYRFEWRGLDAIKNRKGCLILPNHPGELDPIFLTLKLWPTFEPRAVAIEDFYYMGGVHTLMSIAKVIPMPNVSLGGSAYQRLRVRNALDEVCAALKRGENVLIYPSGRMMRDKVEIIGGASAVHDILSQVPDANIILARTRGFLGSSFSWVLGQQRPDLGKALKQGIKWTLINLLWFNPRRKITVDFEDATETIPRDADKQTLNRWLEDWYNKPGPEELSMVSFCRWKKVLPEAAVIDREVKKQDVEIPDDVRKKVIAQLADIVKLDAGKIEEGMTLAGDLGFDSLNAADTVVWLEEEFFVTDVDMEDLVTVHDVMAAAVGNVRQETADVEVSTPETWNDPGPRPDLFLPDPEKSIQLQFLANCDRMPDFVAMGDESSVLTYKRVKLGALVLADVIQKQVTEERVGIMLPATPGTNVVLMAAMLADKVPVMINWTLGDANLEHVLKVSGIKTIISSRRFLDRLDQMNFDLLKDSLVTLEDWKAQHISLGVKLRAKLRSGKSPAALCKLFGCDHVKPNDHAVILFTSGSESTPKGVPLSHRNVLADITAAVSFMHLRGDDSMYGFLPPFHSFGYTVTGIAPMVCGMKTAYYPNPTDSRKLAQGIAKWKPSLVCGTPTFMGGIFRASAPGQMESVRMVVCGAEKAPAELFATGKDLGIEVLEGYGITETSPVLTLNPPGEERVGVGQAIGDVDLKIVDLEERKPLPLGERGLILAAGANVFDGYLVKDSTDSFHELDGKRYYVTGDLGYLDEKGNLTLSGRLKRFVKIAGEMISLPAMEQAISKKWPTVEGLAQTAIVSHEPEGERAVLCICHSVDLTTDEVNAVLKEAGFPNLARVTRQIQVEEIPQLGTGKTDYQTLKGLLLAELVEE